MEGEAYLALQHAETTLVNVHDGVVDALPRVDDVVVVNTDHDVGGTVVLSCGLLALVGGLVAEPVRPLGELVLLEKDVAQEFNMAAREEVVSTVNVDDALTGQGTGALEELAEVTLFAGRSLRLGFEGRTPEPNLGAGSLGCFVGGIESEAVVHRPGGSLALLVRAATLRTVQYRLKRLDEVGAGAEQHAADEVCSRDARGALNDLEAAGLLDEAVAVIAIGIGGNVVAVDDVLAAKVGDVGQLGDIGGVADGAGDPSAGIGGGETLLEVHDGRALVGHDVLVGVDAAVELVAELSGLDHGAGVACALGLAVMGHVGC